MADLDETLAELGARGSARARQGVGAAGRKATVLDPDGNTVAMIEVR